MNPAEHNAPARPAGARPLHADAARTLREWTAPDPAQDGLRRAYLDHLDEHPDGMWKACRAGHLTASALVIDPVGERVLLTLHRKLEMWLQTGGHCEPEDATLAAAALREATEESGVDGLALLPGGPVRLDRHSTPCAVHLDVQYAALAPPGAAETVSEESLELRWYRYTQPADLAELAAVADDSVLRLVTAARHRL
ncbi:NUDIX hydrolase [Streptomyces alkaliterrae]|uniref:NUDIX domain-containing protein n=1 Tax=Streptomyces alkaliterrae TaxID=2213162 RepID=A0A5P0YK37_9ACTN|nr:NUDIX domain-containing protein [Streptomyces alkaliterrae]MBB1258678.1 NUDIX domain-containing protein [Streptomyces alkaliterrae]MQS00571.1 NUDIX domain-containing protein [Streptomyces alkaliterrae]